MQTVIGAFDNQAAAQRAVERLVQTGLDRQDIHVQQQDDRAGGAPGPGTPGAATTMASRDTQGEDQKGGIGNFFSNLFGMDDASRDTGNARAHAYEDAVRRGHAIVVVDAQDEAQADHAAELLHECGAVDVDEDASRTSTAAAMPSTGAATLARSTGASDTRRPASQDTLQPGKEGVLDVVQEELQVGKRSVDRGGVRVIQRVSQKPVREIVRLREERATVDRRAVDREASAADLANFREGTIEVRETIEQPVVSKTARVVEEVRVGKQVQEREQTIEDTVRRKDVDIEQLSGDMKTSKTGGGALERDTRDSRAYAAGDASNDGRSLGEKAKDVASDAADAVTGKRSDTSSTPVRGKKPRG